MLAIIGIFAVKTYAGGTEAEIADEKTLVRMMALVSKGKDSNNKVNINTFFSGYEGVTTSAISSEVIQVTFAKTGNSYQVNLNTAAIIGDTVSTNYTLTYNANGGTGAPPAQIATIGETITLSSTEPTRDGFSFLGWDTSASATTATYTAGDEYTGDTNTTLFAVWSGNQYIITYNANGGTGAPEAQTATVGENITLSTTIPTREGFAFLGWSTDSTATSAEYQPGASYNGNKNIRLYAIWEGVAEYTITYDANGGTGAPEEQTAIAGENITLSSTVPTREGYTFLGWSTDSSASSATYAPGASYTVSADVTLYAIWEEDVVETYTITFDANGGTGGPSEQSAIVGEETTLSSTKPTRTGYNFLGWNTDSSASSATYSAGGSYTGSSDVTLYAVWSIKEYTLTFNANGGSFERAQLMGATIINETGLAHGTSYTVPSTTEYTPTRDGYAFLGWAVSSVATTATIRPGTSIIINANRTLYAVWQSTTSAGTGYTITYNANGGTFSDGSTTMTETDTTGTITTTKPTKSGYTFSHWSTSSNSLIIGTTYQPGATITLTGNIALYAQWSQGSTLPTAKLPTNYTKVALIPIKWTSIILGF